MRLVSYGAAGGERGGFIDEGKIYDLEQALIASGRGMPTSEMRRFLEQPDWPRVLDAAYGARQSIAAIDSASARLGPPVPIPRKLIIAGANTRSHLAEAAALIKDIAPPCEPMILAKATSSLCGARDPIIHPRETRKLDYEIELGVVIGRFARRITERQVKEHVAGFVTINEVSARDVQLAEKESNAFYRAHFLGKSFDTFCPCGPALVTTDEFDWGKPLAMRTEVNGETRQSSDTSDLYFSVEALVSYISQAMTLFPGDIISTGSPAGVGLLMNPPRFLVPGDRVRCDIEGVGAIENEVVADT